MEEYLVTLPIEGRVTYRVKAESEREAKDIVFGGDCGEHVDILWDFADTEHNHADIEEV